MRTQKGVYHSLLQYGVYVVLLVFAMQGVGGSVFAETTYPGGSAYFSNNTIQEISIRDREREQIDSQIWQLAGGDFTKNLALRSYMYRYLGERARGVLDVYGVEDSNGIKDPQGMKLYSYYVNLQTKLYQDLQTVLKQARYVLDDPYVGINTLIIHLTSRNKRLLYFYATLPKRYVDMQNISYASVISTGLQKYFIANETYPRILDELVETYFLKKSQLDYKKNVLYAVHNPSSLEPLKLSYVELRKPTQPRYALLVPVEREQDIDIYTQDIAQMREYVLQFSYNTRYAIKNSSTPRGTGGAGGAMGWKIYLSAYK